jgi:hypothetical protein
LRFTHAIADNHEELQDALLTLFYLIEDTLMFGGTMMVPFRLRAQLDESWWLPLGTPEEITPVLAARRADEEEGDFEDEEEEDDEEDEDEEDEEDLEDDEDFDEDFDDEDFDDEDFDDDDFDDLDDDEEFDDLDEDEDLDEEGEDEDEGEEEEQLPGED